MYIDVYTNVCTFAHSERTSKRQIESWIMWEGKKIYGPFKKQGDVV